MLSPAQVILARLNTLNLRSCATFNPVEIDSEKPLHRIYRRRQHGQQPDQRLAHSGMEPGLILASDIDSSKTEHLRQENGIRIASNQELVNAADIIVLAVKPQVLGELCQEIDLCSRSQLVVSVAAGIPLARLESWLGSDTAIVRCMPNTPALIGKGVSGMIANASTSESQKALASDLMAAVGITVWVETEQAIDAVTAVSGSGPAYYFLFLEAMQEAAEAMGLPADTARILCMQTASGACELANSSGDSVSELRRKVTSPGGTTEQAILQFESGGLRELVRKACALLAIARNNLHKAESIRPVTEKETAYGSIWKFCRPVGECNWWHLFAGILLRFLLQIARADFYNPVSQAVVRLTDPMMKIFRSFIPGYRYRFELSYSRCRSRSAGNMCNDSAVRGQYPSLGFIITWAVVGLPTLS